MKVLRVDHKSRHIEESVYIIHVPKIQSCLKNEIGVTVYRTNSIEEQDLTNREMQHCQSDWRWARCECLWATKIGNV